MNTVELHLYGITGTANYPDMQEVRIIGFFFENWLFDVENKFIQTALFGYIFIYVQIKYEYIILHMYFAIGEKRLSHIKDVVQIHWARVVA